MRNSMADKAADRLQQALDRALAGGAAAAKLGFGQTESIGCSFENGRLKSSDTQQSIGIHVDVVAGGRRGSTACNRLGELDEMVDRALVLAKAGSVAHFEAYPAPAPVADVKTHSPRTAAMTREAMIQSCQRIADALKAHDADLFIEAGSGRGESEGVLVTSGGLCHKRRDTRWHLYGEVQRTRGTDMLFAGLGRAWRDLNELYDPDRIVEEILADLRRAETPAQPPAGKTTALLHPEIVALFGRAFFMGVNGRSVAKGDSPLRGRLGEQIFDPSITIVDDPHLDYCNGASLIDADGIPTRKQALVSAGVLERFLYDLDSAGLAGVEPTGNSGCGPWSPDVLPGERPHEELLAGIDDGIYLKQLLGFGQSNIINGDFASNVALGFRIKDGRIVGRVKNTMVAGNIYELLKSNVQLSSDKDPVTRTPYAVIEGLAVSAAAET